MVWSFTCFRPESSERLIEFAQALSNVDQNHATFQAYYPMYTLPVDSILHMVYPTAHEQLLADNSLVIFDQSLGQAMFISHEWSGRSHPDPYGEQVRVLQDALHHTLYVADTVPVEFASELIFGQDRGMMTSELKSRELFVWFDFFSCPQLEGSVQGIEDVQQQNAIRSIPAYVEMSRFFVIHCPFVRRDGSDHLLNKHTWARRAWCRLERLASQLHAGEDKYIIEVHSAKHQFLNSPYEFCRDPVGEGNFTITSDREVAAGVLHSMFTKRLQFHLKRKEFHSYRILLNLQYSQFRALPLGPIQDVIPGFCDDDCVDERTLAFRKFMYQNGFEDVISRDEAGWSPICYAALRGDPAILQALIQRGASPQDTTTKATPKLFMVPYTSLLVMCIYLKHHEALKFLLSNGADVHCTDNMGSTAMHYACVNQNAEAIDILISFGASATTLNSFSHSPRILSGGAGVGSGALGVIDRVLTDATIEEVSIALHNAIMFGGASAEVVSALIDRGADVNQPLKLPMFSMLQLVFGFLALKNRWNRTAVTYFATQYADASPLMCCILCGAFEAAAVLVAAGARLDQQNQNGLTAQDLVAVIGAPDFVQAAVQGNPDQCEALVTRYFDTQSINF